MLYYREKTFEGMHSTGEAGNQNETHSRLSQADALEAEKPLQSLR